MPTHDEKLKAALEHLGERYAMHPSNRVPRLPAPREQAHADVKARFDRVRPGWNTPPAVAPALVVVRSRGAKA
jgi:hypothetical protein